MSHERLPSGLSITQDLRITYQIFTYVKNKDREFGNKLHTVSGMLLYAGTDETIQPECSYQMSGNRISVRTLDLNKDFAQISGKLNMIIGEYFSE